MLVREVIEKINNGIKYLIIDKKYSKEDDKLDPLIIVLSELQLQDFKKRIDSLNHIDVQAKPDAFKPINDYLLELAENQSDDACYAFNHRIRMNNAVTIAVEEMAKVLKPKFYDLLFPNLSLDKRAHIEKLQPYEFIIGENNIPIIIFDCLTNAINSDGILRHTYKTNAPLTPADVNLIINSSIETKEYYASFESLKNNKDEKKVDELKEKMQSARKQLFDTLKSPYRYIATGSHGVLGKRRLSARVFSKIKDINQLLEIMTTLMTKDRWMNFFSEASEDMLSRFYEQGKSAKSTPRTEEALTYFMKKTYLPDPVMLFDRRLNENKSNLENFIAVFLKENRDDWEKGLSLIATNVLAQLLLGKEELDRDSIQLRSQNNSLYKYDKPLRNLVVQLLFIELYKRYMMSTPIHTSGIGAAADRVKGMFKFFGSTMTAVSEKILSVNDRDSKIAAVNQVLIPCLCHPGYFPLPANIKKYMSDKQLQHHEPTIFGSALVNNPLSSLIMNQNLLAILASLHDQYSKPDFYYQQQPAKTISTQSTNQL